MARVTGANSTFAIFEEQVYGVDPVSPDAKKLYLTNMGLDSTRKLIDDETLTSSRTRGKPFNGNIDVNGSLEAVLSAQATGLLFKHMFGTVVHSGAGPYTHTYTVGALPESFGVEVDYGSVISGAGRYVRYNGLRINKAAFKFPTEGACTVSFDVLGAATTSFAAPLDATITDSGHTAWSVFNATIKEGGAVSAQVKTLDFDLMNDLDSDGYVIGSAGKRVDAIEGFSTISGTLTALFKDTVLLDKAAAGTTSSLEITLTRGDGLGTANNESMTFTIPNLLYEQKKPGIQGPKGVLITLPFKAFGVGVLGGMQLVVKNAVATF